MFLRIIVTVIIIFFALSKSVLANCDFNHYDFLEELNDPSFLKSINIKVNKKKKFLQKLLSNYGFKIREYSTKFKKKFSV